MKKLVLLVALLCVLAPAAASAQAVPATPTDRLAFDYDPLDLARVVSFKLCVDLPAWPVDGGADQSALASCTDVGIPTAEVVGGVTVYPLAFPALTPGQHRLAVYAVNPAGFARSNLLDVQVFVTAPPPPRDLRILPGGGV